MSTFADCPSARAARALVIVGVAQQLGRVGSMCSIWTVTNWLAAPPARTGYYAMIMAMGSLATACCLSSIRFATFLNLIVGLAPVGR